MGCPRCNATDTVTLVDGRWECSCGWRQYQWESWGRGGDGKRGQGNARPGSGKRSTATIPQRRAHE